MNISKDRHHESMKKISAQIKSEATDEEEQICLTLKNAPTTFPD